MNKKLDDRLTALREAADLAEGRLDDADVEAARAVVAKAGARLGLGLESTVVALAGPTGVGKSQLFNVLTETDLAAVDGGVRRPRPVRRRSGPAARTPSSTGSRSSGVTVSTRTGWAGSSCSISPTSTPSRRRIA